MKKLKIATQVLLLILLILIIIALSMGGYTPLISVAFGFLFIYYLIFYIFLIIISKKTNKVYQSISIVIFALPFLLALLDYQALFGFLLQGV
ncbi:hypothetical protein QSV08_07680 [Maribacter sp. BPC-D8]|uniref:hypothetical protein n=1 Tax=Maribacter sp. BPC-D8 TaxID=3053613 RepID=UPI002B4672B1|nr:hypothetical protein [Maribacter sp. BPC-D8]WRI31124.1 hypothetical protein QSV08_07680 [Maribacter sp. BPC-D8]